MKLRITHKLLLSFLLTNAVVIILMLVCMRWSFARGFLDYIHQQEIRRLDSLVAALEGAYAEHGHWHFLRHKPRRWRQLLEMEVPMRPEQPGLSPADDGPALPAATEPPSGHDSPHAGRRGRAGRLALLYRSDDPLSLRLRLSVLDEEQHPVIGPPHAQAGETLRPITYAGRTVGWLRIVPLQAVTDTLDRHFLAQQSQAFVLITSLAVALAAGVSILLGRHLLAPIQKLLAGTRALTAGQFTMRLGVTSGDELGQLAADFNVLAQTLEHNEDMRRQWTADISHELRTPLTILRGEIEALQDGLRPANAETLQSLHAEVLRLQTLVHDLYELSLSDLGALHYRKTPVELTAVLDEALLAFRERFTSKALTLETPGLPGEAVLLFADRARLHQLLSNLLEDSLRYTDPGGCVRVWYIRQEKAVVLHVQDSAPGVSPDALPHLFDRFYRTDTSRTRSPGGAGLGLAICKNIAEAHGGQIAVQPSPLGGVWIQVTLPVYA
ncbi:MAG: HAMP domain-containing protein [Candidatus Tectomicrobia bacterium]|uniref:histidine kinase n=1 Tax=Tectimicrobiota bacterium TaxID=2528274 RepID=A0A937VYA0_UNCTE|nr:HAMP domain-containing protein [Candidatus Tectomicrobia bacterium]